MSDQPSSTSQVLRTPKVIIAIVVAVVVLLIWLLAFFLPSNSKISNYNAQLPQLQAKEARLQAEVVQLQKVAAGQGALSAKQVQLSTAVPPASDANANLNYLHALYATETQAGVTQLTISSIQAPTAASQTSSIVAIPVTIGVSGTYDQMVIFMKLLYNLPRLTTISTVTIGGGGPGTSRGSNLSVNIAASIYANTAANAPSPPSNAAPTSSTSTAIASLPQCSTPTQPAPRDPLDPTLTPQSPLLEVPTCIPAGMPAVAPTTTTAPAA